MMRPGPCEETSKSRAVLVHDLTQQWIRIASGAKGSLSIAEMAFLLNVRCWNGNSLDPGSACVDLVHRKNPDRFVAKQLEGQKNRQDERIKIAGLTIKYQYFKRLTWIEGQTWDINQI